MDSARRLRLAPITLILALIVSSIWGQDAKRDGAVPRTVKPRLTLVEGDLGLRGDMVEDLAFSPDCKLLAVACSASKGGIGRGARGGVSIWDVDSRQKIAGFAGLRNHDVSSLRFSPDGKLLAVGDFGGGLLLWDLAGNGPTATIDARPPGTRREDEHSGSPLLGGFRFSPDGKSLVVFPSHDGQLRTWDVATHRPIESLTTARDLNLGDLHQQPDGKSFALGYSVDAVEAGLIGNEPTRLLLWNLTAKKAVWSKAEVSPFGTAKFSADGRRVILFEPSKDAEQHPPKQVLVLDRATGRTIATYRSDDEIKDAAPSPDGELLAVALGFNNADNQPRHPGEIRMVDAETGRPVARVVLDEPGWPAHLTFSSDGRQIAALGGNGSVKVWRVAEILEP